MGSMGAVSRVAARLVRGAVMALGLAFAASGAQAACENALDFTGAAVNTSRTLDVSSCSNDIRWGLYKLLGTDANDFFPVSGTASYTTAPDSADITLSNNAVLRFTP